MKPVLPVRTIFMMVNGFLDREVRPRDERRRDYGVDELLE